jgi:hypothetical protein
VTLRDALLLALSMSEVAQLLFFYFAHSFNERGCVMLNQLFLYSCNEVDCMALILLLPDAHSAFLLIFH